MNRGDKRDFLPGGPDFFSGSGDDRPIEDGEYNDALRKAGCLFAHEAVRIARGRRYVHVAIQGLRTSVRLLELLDTRQMGDVDEEHAREIARSERSDAAESARVAKSRKAARK